MNLMDVRWEYWPQAARKSIENSLSKHFSGSCPPGNSQAIGNILYSFENVGAKWTDFSESARRALINGFMEYLDEMSSQEFANSLYGFGGMLMSYEEFTEDNIKRIDTKLAQLQTVLGEKELTSLCYGFAKMGTTWQKLPKNFQKLLFTLPSNTANFENISALGLTNAIYTLGVFELDWKELPIDLRDYLMDNLLTSDLNGSFLANVIYGFGLLGVDWYEVPENVRNLVCEILMKPNVMESEKPQHISMTLWGLSKMKATWDDLPGKHIEIAFRDGLPFMLMEEFGMSLYGLAMLDVSWSALDYPTKLAIRDGLLTYAKPEIDSSQVRGPLVVCSIDELTHVYLGTCELYVLNGADDI
jgi:hypothetical protein